MAVPHLDVRAHSRSKGHSVAAAVAYRQGFSLIDCRTGTVHNYAHRHVRRQVRALGFAYGDHPAGWMGNDRKDFAKAPEPASEQGAPVAKEGIAPTIECALSHELTDEQRAVLHRHAQAFADALEQAERRKNSCIARDIECALPHELDEHQRIALAARMAQRLAKRYNAPVAFAVHDPDPRSDQRNFHVHCLLATRKLAEDGTLGPKLRDLDNQTRPKDGGPSRGVQEILAIRADWERLCNEALAGAGLDVRIDMGRGDTPAQPKMGPAVTGMERRTTQRQHAEEARAAKRENRKPPAPLLPSGILATVRNNPPAARTDRGQDLVRWADEHEQQQAEDLEKQRQRERRQELAEEHEHTRAARKPRRPRKPRQRRTRIPRQERTAQRSSPIRVPAASETPLPVQVPTAARSLPVRTPITSQPAREYPLPDKAARENFHNSLVRGISSLDRALHPENPRYQEEFRTLSRVYAQDWIDNTPDLVQTPDFDTTEALVRQLLLDLRESLYIQDYERRHARYRDAQRAFERQWKDALRTANEPEHAVTPAVRIPSPSRSAPPHRIPATTLAPAGPVPVEAPQPIAIPGYVSRVADPTTIVYRRATDPPGARAFADTGQSVRVHQAADPETVLAALTLATQKWAPRAIRVRGSPVFRALSTRLAAEHGIRLANPESLPARTPRRAAPRRPVRVSQAPAAKRSRFVRARTVVRPLRIGARTLARILTALGADRPLRVRQTLQRPLSRRPAARVLAPPHRIPATTLAPAEPVPVEAPQPIAIPGHVSRVADPTTIVYRRATDPPGARAFADTGQSVRVHQAADPETVLAALTLAAEKWAPRAIRARGSPAFRALSTRLAAEHGIRLANPESLPARTPRRAAPRTPVRVSQAPAAKRGRFVRARTVVRPLRIGARTLARILTAFGAGRPLRVRPTFQRPLSRRPAARVLAPPLRADARPGRTFIRIPAAVTGPGLQRWFLRVELNPGGPHTYRIFDLKVDGGEVLQTTDRHEAASEWLRRQPGKPPAPKDVNQLERTLELEEKLELQRQRARGIGD